MNQAVTSHTTIAVPFTIEQIQEDICRILVMEARKLSQLMHEDRPLMLAALGLATPAGPDFWDASATPAEAGLTYDMVADSTLAKAMLDHYDFAFHAIETGRTEAMRWDSIHTAIGAYILSLQDSPYAAEWEGEGDDELPKAIKRCLQVIETSNARLILEGEEPFYDFASDPIDQRNEGPSATELTIRQLSMLAGLEEMTLRSAISRKTSPQLVTRKEDRRTYVEAQVAKEWLIAKGKYLPVTRPAFARRLDLHITSFKSAIQLASGLAAHLACLAHENPLVELSVLAVIDKYGALDLNNFAMTHAGSAAAMRELAVALQLPAELLRLRAREAHLFSQLAETEIELYQQKAADKAADSPAQPLEIAIGKQGMPRT